MTFNELKRTRAIFICQISETKKNLTDISNPVEFSTSRAAGNAIMDQASCKRLGLHYAVCHGVYFVNKKYEKRKRKRKKERRRNKWETTRQVLHRRCITRCGINPRDRRGSKCHSHLPCFSVRRHNSLCRCSFWNSPVGHPADKSKWQPRKRSTERREGGMKKEGLRRNREKDG